MNILDSYKLLLGFSFSRNGDNTHKYMQAGFLQPVTSPSWSLRNIA